MSQVKPFWQKLLSFSIPHKVKIFVWRACNNILPSFQNLEAKGVLVMNTCRLYGGASEYILHALVFIVLGLGVAYLSDMILDNFQVFLLDFVLQSNFFSC